MTVIIILIINDKIGLPDNNNFIRKKMCNHYIHNDNNSSQCNNRNSNNNNKLHSDGDFLRIPLETQQQLEVTILNHFKH